MLARPYRAVLSLARMSPTANVQAFDASGMPPAALAYLGVRWAMVPEARPGLREVHRAEDFSVYEIPNPAMRAAYFPQLGVEFLSSAEIHERFRAMRSVPATLMLPPQAERVHPSAASLSKRSAATPTYRRPSTDVINVDVDAPDAGWVRVLETADAGWSATVDGKATPITLADDAFIAVPVDAGRHSISLRYRTPGATAGIAISVTSLFLLGAFCYYTARQRNPQEPPPESEPTPCPSP
jgi:hypothetical protein